MRGPLIFFAAALPLLAQVDARELVRQSIRNGEQAWKESRNYTCQKVVSEKEFGGGQVRSTDKDVYEIVPVQGDSFEEHLSHDGAALGIDEQHRQERELARREHEALGEQAQRLAKEERERSYYNEIPAAFDFKIAGEENLPTGPAWVVSATPRAGFEPHSRYSHMFPKMEGKLWIDQKDIQWVKADAIAIENVTFGYFIARLAKGSHIILEQTRLPDGTWVPKHIEAKASARTFLFFNHNFEEDITYSNYRKRGGALSASAQRR